MSEIPPIKGRKPIRVTGNTYRFTIPAYFIKYKLIDPTKTYTLVVEEEVDDM